MEANMPEKAFFVEVFPVLTANIPKLHAYALQYNDQQDERATAIGGKLSFRLNASYPGRWVWADYRILTDTPVSSTQLDITLDILRRELPELYGDVVSIEEDPRWQITPLAQAQYILKTKIRHRDWRIREALARMRAPVKNAFVEREPIFQTWVINDEPAISISVRSQVRYHQNLQNYMQTLENPETVLGLRVLDKTSPTMVAEVKAITGTLGEHRDRLLKLTKREVMQQILKDTLDSAWVVLVDANGAEYEYVASALHILLSVSDDELLARFDVSKAQVLEAMRMKPDYRASLVKVVSDLLKSDDIIDNAYNQRTHPHLFAEVDFMPNLVYGSNRVYPYVLEQLGIDFLRGGLFKMHTRFNDEPIRIAVINMLDDIASDFVEAMRRQLERDFGFQIEMIRERRVRVVNQKNIESAMRVVERENPHLLLAFFPSTSLPEDEDGHATHLKSLSLGKGIATHVVYENTVHNPDAMAYVIMAVLAKTGNVPFALAEPLAYADYVVGLNIIRHRMTKGDRVAALARIYRSDGELVRYAMEMLELEHDEPLPFIVLQTVLPMHEFEGQRIIIHHDGTLDRHIAHMLHRWGEAMQASIYPVEILRHAMPRIYQLEQTIAAPSWGAFFRLNDDECLVVASDVAENRTPKPLYIRSQSSELPIESAAYSVLAWTLLHYGSSATHKVPVTIQHDDDLRHWLARGILPEQTEGDVPFWL
jgi:hypothetical protein